MISISSSDEIVLTLSVEATRHSRLLTSIVKFSDCTEDKPLEIPFKNVNLKPVVDWLENHKDVEVWKRHTRRGIANEKHELTDWELKFMKTLNDEAPPRLFAVLKVAEYLGMEHLLMSGGFFIAQQMKTMTVEECRTYLNVTDDLTAEEKSEVEKWKMNLRIKLPETCTLK